MFTKVKNFLLVNSGVRQTVAKNAVWLGISNVGGRLLRAIIIFYSARVLGASEWGVFSYAVTLAAFLTVFVDLGLNHILVREFSKAKDDGERAKIVSTLFFIKIFLVLTGALIILLIAPHVTKIEGVRSILPMVALILTFDSLREFAFSLARANEKMEREATLFIFTNICIVVSGFVFLAISPTVEFFTYSYALGVGLGFLATFWNLRGYLVGVLSNFSKEIIKPLFLAAWPFAISGLLGGLMLNTDILIIGWFRSAADVGFYSAAQRIIQVLYIIPAVLATSALPLFSRLANTDNAKMRLAVQKILKVVLLMALPLVAGGVLTATPLIKLLFGGEYLPAVNSFQILVFTIVIDFSAVVLANAIFSYNRQKNLIVYAGIGGVCNVIFDLILIPPFGITGSAVATLLAQLISNAYLWMTMKKINHFTVLPHLLRGFLSVVIMGLFVTIALYLKIQVMLVILISAIIYSLMLLLLREPILMELKYMVLGAKNQVDL